MKFSIPKEWFDSRAHLEEGLSIEAGLPQNMNITTDQHLVLVVQFLNHCIEVRKAATEGNFELLDGTVWDHEGVTVISDYNDATSAFIALASGNTISLCEGLLVAIEGLQKLVDYTAVTSRDFSNKRLAHEMAQSILAFFPLEMLAAHGFTGETK